MMSVRQHVQVDGLLQEGCQLGTVTVMYRQDSSTHLISPETAGIYSMPLSLCVCLQYAVQRFPVHRSLIN